MDEAKAPGKGGSSASLRPRTVLMLGSVASALAYLVGTFVARLT